jgi:DUF2917 family protein
VRPRVVGLSSPDFRDCLIIGALPAPYYSTQQLGSCCSVFNGSEVMVTLKLEQSLRIRRSGTTRINCIAGRAWVTNQGDLRDFILERGESVDATRGLTIITALEPALIDIGQTSAVSRLKGLLRMPKAIAAWIEQRIASGKSTSDLLRRTSPVPYY